MGYFIHFYLMWTLSYQKPVHFLSAKAFFKCLWYLGYKNFAKATIILAPKKLIW